MRRRLVIAFAVCLAVVIAIATYHRTRTAPKAPPPLSALGGSAGYSPWQFHKSITQAEKEHILDGRFVIVTKTEAFPSTVKRAFAVITGQKQFALANPGEKYQVTDVVDEPGLPFRRLVFAGVRDDEWFIHYEHGGIGHSYSVVVFSVDTENRLHFIWGGAGASGAKDMQELRSMVSAGRFLDDAAYYW